MDDAKRVTWTRTVVLLGIVLSYLSYPTAKLGWGEIFPFAHWRLYSAPIGINEPFTTYRVYTLDEESSEWKRQPLESTPAYTRKEQGYVLNYWTDRLLNDANDPEAAQNLRSVVHSLAPGASSYRVVSETFYSLPLYADASRYDTSTVARFDR